MSKSDQGYENSSQGVERPGHYTNKGVIVDTYVRHHQDWIVPRRVMCAFFWTGIILLFTGIILLVTSNHKEGAYQSWGSVLLGLGSCLLLICLILCMHAYCVITVNDDEPPMVMTVPPPPPSVLTLANGHKPKDSNSGSDVTIPSQRSVSYGTMQYSEQPEGADNLKSLPEEQSSDISPYQSDLIRDKLKDIKDAIDKSDSGQSTPVMMPSNGDKKSLSQVGKLPSYNTAIKMAPYCPDKRRSHSCDSDVEIGYLKDDDMKSTMVSTLERKKASLRKSVTFDDSTGDVRVEFNGGGSDPDLHDQAQKQQRVSPSYSRPSLGSPPYDNEIDFYLPPSQVLSTIPESPSSQSEISVAFTTTTWSHITPQTHVPLLSVALPTSDDVCSVSCDNRHQPQELSSITASSSSTSPQSPQIIPDTVPLEYSKLPHSKHEGLLHELHIDEDRIAHHEINKDFINGNEQANQIMSQDQPAHFIDEDQLAFPKNQIYFVDSVGQQSPIVDQGHQKPVSAHTQSAKGQSYHMPIISEQTSAVSEEVQGDQTSTGAEGQGQAPVQLRRPLTVQVSDADSTASSKLSVYDNVQYVWRSKSGSELKHYHF